MIAAEIAGAGGSNAGRAEEDTDMAITADITVAEGTRRSAARN